MKKTFLIAALFAITGIASAQNAAPATASPVPAAKPAATAEAAKPADATAQTEGATKSHAKKHTKHAVKKKADHAKAAGTESVAKTAEAPAK
jgi:hypothetical protein